MWEFNIHPQDFFGEAQGVGALTNEGSPISVASALCCVTPNDRKSPCLSVPVSFSPKPFSVLLLWPLGLYGPVLRGGSLHVP